MTSVTEKLLRVGFIGCGSHASINMWPSLRYAPMDVVYACDRNLHLAERNRRRFGASNAVTDAGIVLEDPTVDAVMVIGPPAMHYELGLQALQAGKHVFVDKPPAETLAQTIELEEAAARNGVQCQVGFQKRFALAYRAARDASQHPAFGSVRLTKINYSHFRTMEILGTATDWRWHLTVLSLHALDLIRFLSGDPVEAHVLKTEAEDGRNVCVLMLRFGSGASAVLNLSACDPGVQEWIELSGANQLISVRDLVEYRHWRNPGRDSPSTDSSRQMNTDDIEMWRPEFADSNRLSDSRELQGYVGEVVAFAETLLVGGQVSPSISDAVAAMRLAELILEAPQGMSEIDLGLNASERAVSV
jgi:predicted dehydrogenase